MFFPFIIIIALWSVAIKGYALWHAAHNDQKWWFIALLVLNTVGILEIIYLLWFRPQPKNSILPTPPSIQP
ncbi:MAG: DUF5652 family protein [bacterium]|nr:DUF5652 family protein [bacterium]